MDKKYDRLDEFEYFVNEMRNDCAARITVWDEELQDFVFWKDAFKWNCRIDSLKGVERDCRTTTRK